MNKHIEKLIAIAKNEVGYLEKRSNANLDSKTANAGSGNYTKYWRDVCPSLQGQAWCAVFVTWCFDKAFGKDNTKKLLEHYPYTYCPTMGKSSRLYANPQVGDIPVFKRNGSFVHTGFVVEVSGDRFGTVEGNTSGASGIIANGGGVCKKTYYNSSLPGTKFFRPDYEGVLGKATEDVTVSVNLPMLEKGDSGSSVKALQTLLVLNGISCGASGADGDFGSDTDSAVKAYQKAKGLTADGVVGKDTWSKLLN